MIEISLQMSGAWLLNPSEHRFFTLRFLCRTHRSSGLFDACSKLDLNVHRCCCSAHNRPGTHTTRMASWPGVRAFSSLALLTAPRLGRAGGCAHQRTEARRGVPSTWCQTRPGLEVPSNAFSKVISTRSKDNQSTGLTA